VYNNEYLDRLELIRRLKDSFLPLKEIRAMLTSLSWDDVRASLANLHNREAKPHTEEQQPAPGGSRKVGEDRSSALEYISSLLASTPVNRPLLPPPAAPLDNSSNLQASASNLESWQRVRLAPGIEIHLRQPLRHEDQQKIDHILRLAKKLFPS
jgi:DNA-binding transcriptional MerR regulator